MIELTILGAPRTKKTHQRIIRVKGAPRIVPAEASKDWENDAILQLRGQVTRLRRAGQFLDGRGWPCAWMVNVRARIYRDANRGDAAGYYQAIGDALERAGVVENDKLIESWDGSRRLIDRVNPRVEIELEPLA